MKFLQFLVVFFAIFFLVRLIFRALLPGLLRMVVRKMGYKFTQQYAGQRRYQAFGQERYQAGPEQYQSAQENQSREGDIRVEYVPPKKKARAPASKKTGEFVEFEEVKLKKE